MKPEPLTFPLVILVVSIQVSMSIYISRFHPLSWQFLLAAYLVGGTLNQNLFLAIHEITHNLAFKGWRKNRFLAMLANIPIGIPYAMVFKVSYRIKFTLRGAMRGYSIFLSSELISCIDLIKSLSS
jgi:sphingolipid 4-desaturase/C4-monooxygenase